METTLAGSMDARSIAPQLPVCVELGRSASQLLVFKSAKFGVQWPAETSRC